MAGGPQSARPLRLFVAVELPVSWRAYLAALAQELERLAPGYARWVAPALLHLTVVFLGNQAPSRLPPIDAALRDATGGQRPFSLALGRLGHFGGAVPRVLWVEGRAPAGALDALHAEISAQLAARAVVFDTKPLVPHLTLGRARRDADPTAGRRLVQRLCAFRPPSPPAPFTVDALTLMRSDLAPRGPHYSPLERYRLTDESRAE